MRNLKNILYSIITFLLLGMGISLQLKAGIGQSMFNAFSLLFADLFRIEVGTMINIFNLLFFIVYLIIKASPFNGKDGIQIIATLMNGFIINFLTYSLLDHITIHSYYLRVLLFLLGLALASISLGAILAMGLIRFPLESLCIELSQKTNYSLAKIRMRFDIFFLISTILITVLFHSTLYIREGTVISFFLLSRLMGLSYEYHKNKIVK